MVFGLPFDDAKYQKVLKSVCLEEDLEGFPDGDQTQVRDYTT